LPAPQAAQTVSASPASQTISFSTNAPATAMYNSAFNVLAIATSSLPVLYTSSGACTNIGATYTMTSGTGTCSVIANQAGNNNYSSAPPVTQTVNASVISQTIAFTTNGPTSASFNTSFTVAATASSNLPVAYTSTGACSNSGATYTMISGTGTCSVIASQAGNSNYSGAPQVAQTVGASLIAQTIMFTANAPASAAFNNNFTVAATATSGSPVLFTSAGSCGNSGATYTITGSPGTCTVIANQPGNTNYSAAAQVTQSTTATIAAQTITVTTKAPASAAYNSSFTVLASASSGLPILFSSSGACTNSGATYTMNAATGTCSVIANQAGNANYTAAPKITELTTASKASPTVTLGGVPPTAPYLSTFTVTTSTNASTTAVITANGCLISGVIVTMNTGTGKCNVTAAWAADSLYLPASISQSTTAVKLSSTITWATPAAVSYGTALSSAQLNATASSGSTALTGSLVYTPGSGNIPLAGNGTLSVTFTPTNNANYSNASGSVVLVVNQLSTTTKITSTSPSAPIVGQAVQVNFSVTAGYSKPTQRVTVNSSTGETCSAALSSGTGFCSLTFLTAGPRTLTAAYSGDNNNLTSTSAGFPLSIISNVKIAPTVTFTGAPATAPYQSAFVVTATTNASTKAVISAVGSCSISGATVTMTLGTGTCTVTANWAADIQYLAASASQSTTAQKLPSTITWATPAAINYGTPLNSTELNATASSGAMALTGSFVYKPASGSIPIAGNDTLAVTFTPTNTAGYTSATSSVNLVVNQISTTTRITSTTPSAPKEGQSVQVNVSVTGSYGKPTQNVTVNSSTGETCSATLSSGAGSCSLILLTAGSRTLTATYSGDNNDVSSTSVGFPLSIAPSSGDFSLSMSPSSISVSPGGTSASAILTANSLSGFLGTVSLTISGLPPGVTSSPSSPFNVIARGGYPFLTFVTFTASTAVAPGSYSITIQGVSGSIAHSTNLTLNVVNPSDFNLLISPSGISVSPGATSSPLIASVVAIGGFSGAVSVSIGGLPNGVTASPSSPFSVNAAGNQQITITVPSSVPNGTYPIVLTGTSGAITHTTNTLLTVGAVTFSQVFQHVIVIFQENRTPDNLFHDLPNADIANSGINSSGQVIPLTVVPLAVNYDNDHSHEAFLAMYDGGKIDGADKIYSACDSTPVPGCPPTNPQFKYVDPNDVQPYFLLAEQFTFGDRMFQTNQGPSFPAHQFIIAGTSAPTATSNLFAADTATDGYGCGAAPDSYAQLINPAGGESQTMYPCFEHPTLMDLLDPQGITWRYYTPLLVSLWTGPYAIEHIYFGPDWANVVTPETTVLTDIANNRLPQVSWVIPSGYNSDHPGSAGGGPSWVASIVNAIGNSQYWGNTAIIITWDDWGGWYDHVAPPIYNSYEYGFRVPLIIVSPYSKQGYVSHVTHDFGSILKFTEEVFNLPSLGYADARADDLSDCFDLTQTPITFQMVPAALPAEFFLNDKRPPAPPDNDDDEK
jgi:phospholipase C